LKRIRWQLYLIRRGDHTEVGIGALVSQNSRDALAMSIPANDGNEDNTAPLVSPVVGGFSFVIGSFSHLLGVQIPRKGDDIGDGDGVKFRLGAGCPVLYESCLNGAPPFPLTSLLTQTASQVPIHVGVSAAQLSGNFDPWLCWW